jgi:glycosyltransferase involved in cell wall biosynthesis
MSLAQRLVSLTNIPTPYRVHFYNALAPALAAQGVALEVMFMAETEPGRRWTFDERTFAFEHWTGAGWHPMVGGRLLHFNPTLVGDLAAHPPGWLLISGSWFLPTAALATGLAGSRGAKTIFWSESNLAYVEHRSGAADRLRTGVMDRFDAYAVPGQWAEAYVRHFAPSAVRKPFLRLPNVIDDAGFKVAIARHRADARLWSKWGLEEARRPILFTACRLAPIKGIAELIRLLIATRLDDRLTLLVAGDGELRPELERTIAAAGCEARIRLLGFRSEAEVQELLALADAFILPSLGDPFPVAVVEAVFAGLPLLLSDRVGCHPEALPGGRGSEAGQNGFLFDPTDPVSIAGALTAFLAAGADAWRQMGMRSLQIAEETFSTAQVVERFAEAVLAL